MKNSRKDASGGANQWPADLRLISVMEMNSTWRFHFPLMPGCSWAEVGRPQAHYRNLAADPEIPPSCQWCLFLRNHDELTLEMVTDAERDYMYDTYAESKTMRLNLGIRRRLAPLLDNDAGA